MTAETQKMLQRVKRQQNPMFKGGRPDRTLKILQRQDQTHNRKINRTKFNLNSNFIDLKGLGEGESVGIVKKMKMLEDQFIAHQSDYQNKSVPQRKQSINVS